MFDIGFWELVLIAIIGLVVLGPERLPVAIRNISRWVGAAKRMAGSVRDELEQELKLKELQDNLHKAEQAGMKDLSPELQESVDTCVSVLPMCSALMRLPQRQPTVTPLIWIRLRALRRPTSDRELNPLCFL